jgi:hypothetical protein
LSTPVTENAPPAPTSDGGEWWVWIFRADGVFALIASAALFARRLRIRPLLHRGFSGW